MRMVAGQEAFLLLRRAVLNQRRYHPGADRQVVRPDPGRAQLSVDDELLERLSVTAPRLGQMRHHPAAGGQGAGALGACELAELGKLGADSGAEFGVAVWKLDARPAQPPARAG